MSQLRAPITVVSAERRRAFQSALDGSKPTIVVVRGPSGSGKTSLLRSIVIGAADSSSPVRMVTASPSSPVPYSALAPLIHRGDLVELAPGDVLATFSVPADGLAPTLIIDDAAHLDDASAALVQQLGLNDAINLVFGIRDGHSMPAAIASLLGARPHTTVRVEPLVGAEIGALADRVLGGPLDDSSMHALTEASGGNPLYIRELLTGARDAGVVTDDNGVWRFSGRLTLSPLLEELIVARLGPLTTEERRLVELVAVGGPLPIDVVTQIVDLAVVETLENRDIITVSDVDHIELIHPLYGELSLAGIGRLTRQRRFAELAQAELAARGAGASETESMRTLRSTVWHVRGGLDPGDEELLGAARLAMKSFDPSLAAELAGRAFEQGNDGHAALVAAWGLATTGRHDTAADLLRTALATVTDPWLRTACRLRLAEELWWWRHDLDGARALLIADGSGAVDEILTAQLGVFAVLDGDIDGAEAICGPLVDHPSILVRFVAAIGRTHALAASDRADEALVLAQHTFDECTSSDEDLLGDPNIHIVNQIMALLHVGRLDDARFYGELINDAAAQQPAPISKAWGSLMSGFAQVLSGEPERGRARLAQAESYWREADVPGIQRWAVAGRALADAALGQAPAPLELLESLEALPAAGFRLYDYLAELAVTWAAVGHDDTRLARVHARAALGAASAPVHRAHVAHDLARLGLTTELGGLSAPQRAGPMSAARWLFVEGVLGEDPAALEGSGEAFANCGAHLFAAEAFALAVRLHKRAGRRREVTRLDGRCGHERQLCGAVDTPPLRGRRTGGTLSTREHQVATLAAQGLTNRAIADRLIIGERTVETHLSHVYTKLGVGTRSELSGLDLS